MLVSGSSVTSLNYFFFSLILFTWVEEYLIPFFRSPNISIDWCKTLLFKTFNKTKVAFVAPRKDLE